MSTYNICIRREIRKILCGYPLLSSYVHGGDIKQYGIEYKFRTFSVIITVRR